MLICTRYLIIIADTWLHATTSTIQLLQALPSPSSVSAYGRGFYSSDCVSITGYTPCSVGISEKGPVYIQSTEALKIHNAAMEKALQQIDSMVTVARGTFAPLGSRTVPLSVPVDTAFCARRGLASATTKRMSKQQRNPAAMRWRILSLLNVRGFAGRLRMKRSASAGRAVSKEDRCVSAVTCV